MRRALLISTGVGCGVQCSYCPQAPIVQRYGQRSRINRLSFDVFCRVLEKLPKDVQIHFNGFYEPFLNNDCVRMIVWAHQEGFRIRVSSTLMGLRERHVTQFEDIPFLKFSVHLPDDKDLTKIAVTESYCATLKQLVGSEISNLGFHVHEGPDGPERVQPVVRSLLSELGIVPENRWVLTRAGNIEVPGRVIRGRLTGELELCPRLRANVLLPNGDVALCCMDWKLQHVIGNLLEMDYEMLFQSDEFRKVLSGYTDDSVDILCRRCEIAKTKDDSLRQKAMFNLKKQADAARAKG